MGVAAFYQEKALLGAFSVLMNHCVNLRFKLWPQVAGVEEQEQAGLELPQRGGHLPPLLPPRPLHLPQELELPTGLREISQCPET